MREVTDRDTFDQNRKLAWCQNPQGVRRTSPTQGSRTGTPSGRRRSAENAFAFIVQARPCPTFGRPVHLRGSPHRLQPGTSPHALRIPPHNTLPSGEPRVMASGPPWLVCGFRFRARLGFSIPFHLLRPTRHYPRVRIQRSSFERRRDFNPPEQCAAQRTLRPLLAT
jgi:hypothetical protein